MVVTAEEMKQIKQKGYADVGGIKRKRYWTPDGREISAIPCMRTFDRKKDGKVIESGIRDANLDKGWFEQKPQILIPYCPHCDKWHDTQEEVVECGVKRQRFNKFYEIKARELKEEEPQKAIQDINDRLDRLTKLVEMLVDKKE